MIKKVISMGAIALSSGVMAGDFYRGSAELMFEKGLMFQGDFTINETSATYDSEGTETELSDSQAFSMMNLDLGLSYGINNKFQVQGFTRLRKVELTNNDEITSSTGLESLGLEFKYMAFKLDKTKIALGAHYRHSMAKDETDSNSDAISIGDLGAEFGASLYATYNSAPFKIDAKIGYNSPGEKLSDEIVYRLEGMYLFDSLGFFAGVDGVKSLQRSSEEGSFTSSGGGISNYFNAPDREWMSPYAGAHLSFKDFIFTLKGKTVVSGVNTDKFTTIGVGVRWTKAGNHNDNVKIDAFKEYAVDGSVLKISTRGNFVRIDQGLSSDVEKGMKFDIYQTDYFGGNELVATGFVHSVGSDWSVIQVTKKYKETVIKPGFAARGY